MILTEEGYITLSGATPAYHYYLKDHQGNNRVVINENGTVEQVNHYYPFGGLFGEGPQSSNQPYRYNGKELDRQLNLDLYDYGARHYDAALGRWLTVDPLAEKYYGISPYAYCANNPVRFIDPNGMWYDDPPSNWLIPARPKYEYGNNLLTNSLTFVNNVSADILNTGISIVNTPINAVQTIYKEGVSGLVNSEVTGLKNIGNTIANEVNYTLTTPIGEQLQGFKDPATWEAGAAFGATLFAGGAVANLGKGANISNLSSKVSVSTTSGGNLGNPFKNMTLGQIDEAFQTHVKSGKLQLKYTNPTTGAKAYQNTRSGYSYNLDPGGLYGKKIESPHIDVNYPNPKPLNVDPKKKLQVTGGF